MAKTLLEDDLYSGYDEYPVEFNTKNVESDVIFQQAIGSSYGRNLRLTGKPGIDLRLGTSASIRTGTGFRPITGAYGGVNRPMTAVRGAGYTSQRSGSMFDPLNQKLRGSSPQQQQRKEETPEMKIKKLEKRIMELIEESCVANSKGDHRLALDKAKEASTKERSLIRLQEQASLSESHNLDITFSVLFNLANQYAANDMYMEALNTYQVITKNRMFNNSNRLKVNIGNIYFKLGQYNKAVKMYRMALDQVPNSQKDLKIKIMHNIGILFVKMGQFAEACSSFEYIMQEKADFKSGFHAILCYYALGDKERMRKGMQSLLSVSLNVSDEDMYVGLTDDSTTNLLYDVIKYDNLRKLELKMKQNAEKSILNATRIISPAIDSFMAGYNWCVETIKASVYASLANDLEINKAVMFLKQKETTQAMNALQLFDKKETKMASAVSTMLSSLYFLQGDLNQSEKFGNAAREIDGYSSEAFVNLGNCALSRGQIDKAKELYICAIENDAACIEALYNLGLIYKKLENFDDAMDCFLKLKLIIRYDPEVLYQLAATSQQMGDVGQATEWYLQLLSVANTDPNVYQKIADIYERADAKSQAYQYLYESARFNPSDINVLDWMGIYCMEKQAPGKAYGYYKLAMLVEPDEVRWKLCAATCLHQKGESSQALEILKKIHKKHPDNIDCIKLIGGIYFEQGLSDEAAVYAKKIKVIQRKKEVWQRISSSRPGSFRSGGSGRSSRSSVSDSGSPVLADIRGSPVPHSRMSSKLGSRPISQTNEPFIEENDHDPMYTDPLGPAPVRPRTSAGHVQQDDDFGDEKLGDDMLPD